MKLYDFAFSPNCRKVRAVAYELDVAFEAVHVDLVRAQQHSPEFLAHNPNGRVPVLVDGDFVLNESIAIMRYLARLHGDALMPESARDRADADRWMSWQIAHLGPALSKIAFERIVKPLTGQGTPDEAIVAESSAELAKLTTILDNALADRAYLAHSLSLADFALASHYSLAPTCGLELTPYARVDAWLARMLSRASMKRALDDAHMLMRPHAAE